MLKRAAFVLLALAVLSLGLLPSGATAQTSPPETSSLLVKLVSGLTVEEQAAVVARNGGTETGAIAALRLHVVAVPTVDLAVVLAAYEADPQVQHVEENKVRRSEYLSNDEHAVSQWALPQIGWDLVFGSVLPTGTAKVAVLDSGINALHPDLAGRVVPGMSILDGGDGRTDRYGHGTWVAGIVAANTDNTIGIAGVAFAGVQLMPVTVLDANGEGRDSDVIAGVIWAADHGADVILMAFSNPGFSPNLQDAIDYAWSRGAVLVAAAGNDGVDTPTFPAGDRGVIGVSGTDPADALLGYSNYGKASFLAAPGDSIATTDLNGGYMAISGTSTSAAIVAGAAAFLKAVDPTLTNGIIVGRLARTADPAGTQGQTGNGRVNLARALTDTATDSIQPAGADPVGDGGPFVGPYRADAVSNALITARNTTGPTTCGTTDQTTFPSGTTICARGAFQITGGGSTGLTEQVRIQWLKGGVLQHESSTETFSNPGGGPASYVKTDFETISATTDETWQLRLCSGAPLPTAPCTSGNLRASSTFTVAAPSNSAPSINRDNATVAVNEGQTATNSGTWSDANSGDTVTLSASVGAVTKAGTNAGGTWSWSFATTDGPGQSQTVTITANDGNGGSTSTSFSLTVSNVAPTVAFTGGPTTVDESGTTEHTYTYSISDPGNDTVQSVTTSCGTNGTKVPLSDSNTNTTGSFKCKFPDGAPGTTSDVTVAATDSDGATGNTATRTVTISNVAPTVTFTGGPTTVDESGTTEHTYTYSISDPGNDTVQSVTTSCGTNGTKVPLSDSNTNTTGSFKCKFPDGAPGTTSDVTVAATDSDGATGNTATRTVTISNVAPTITSVTASPASVIVGQPVTFSGQATDPSTPDTTNGFYWKWNAGSGYGSYGAANANTYTTTYSTCGSYTVKAVAKDKDGGESDEYTSSLSVYNGNFLPPLKEGMPNLVQKGRVVPVQISFGCGGFQSGLSPEIQLLLGDWVDNAGTEQTTDNLVTESVSNADTTGRMRQVDSKYLYNLAIPNTSQMTPGKALTVRVRPFGPNTSPTIYILLEIRK